MTECVIRPMRAGDLDQLMEVEKASFATPWKRTIFEQELNKNQFAHYFVLLVDNQVVGYEGIWVIIDDVQITNIAILPEFRGLKLGEQLFQYTMMQAVQLGGQRLSLEVRQSNTPAKQLYRKFGLVPGGVRKNYYIDNQEDAIVMWVNLNEE